MYGYPKRKLEVFNQKKTSPIGLWWHPEHLCFSSPVISLSKLKEFKGNVRILVRKNRFYQAGMRRPNYLLSIADSKMVPGENLEVETIEDNGTVYLRKDDALSIARQALRDLEYGYSYDDLSSEMDGEMSRISLTKAEVIDDEY